MRFNIRRFILILLVLLFFVVPFFDKVVQLVTDWWWYQQLGYAIVFTRELVTRWAMGALFGAAFFVFVYFNIWIARRRTAEKVDLDSPIWKAFPYYDAVQTLVSRFLLVIVAVLALFFGSWASNQWDVYLRYANATSFAVADPLFHHDVGFYVFKFPFFQFLQSFAMGTVFFSLLISGLIHLVQGEVSVSRAGVSLDQRLRAHLLGLVALLGVLFSFGYQFDAWNLLYSARGVVYGASYTDIHGDLPILRYLMFAALAASCLALLQIFKKGFKLLLTGIGLIILGIVALAVYPELVQKIDVVPNELNRERPYIQDVIKYTRQAYNIQDVDEWEFASEDSLSANDLKKNEPTIKNIRLWEHAPLLQTYGQLQEIRTYYHFEDVDNDRYTINGEYRQVMLSPRELASEKLPSPNWMNEHLKYTHGYGLCLGPVNMISSEGLPQFFVKDIPPISTTNIKVNQPEIYFGELSNPYCFVKTKSSEFDYPFGEENKYTTYAGTGGVQVNSFLKKLMFALRFKEINFLLANDITGESRLMFYRRVVERVEQLVPMAKVDAHPYMVIDQGRLYWLVDAYTTTQQYPYSEPRPQAGNYIRNSIKALVDAYNGDVQLYVAQPEDPLIQTQMKIFPGVFKPIDQMPPSLRAHIRVPEFIFSIQASIYATYHMTDPQVFFNKEDLWKIPQSALKGQEKAMEPYYTIMKLPSQQREASQVQKERGEEEFILMVPFTPSKKENMIAWMAARCDAPNYGKLVVYDFPKDKLVYGPQQVESRIDQEAEISKQLTLWNQGGSTVTRGSLLVIPIEKSILYVQPLYLSASQGALLPELKRVIVAYGNSIAMEDNLELALARIFGGATGKAAVAPSASSAAQAPSASVLPGFNVDEVIREAGQAYEGAQEAMRSGNWAAYGEQMKKLESALKRLQEKK
jgi:hypothetical protein